MLVKQKIGVVVFGILMLVSFVVAVVPGKVGASTFKPAVTDTNINSTILGVTTKLQSYTSQEILSKLADGKFSGNLNNEQYYLTDGKTIAIYDRGSTYGITNTTDSSTTKLIGVITQDGKYRELTAPILKDGTTADVANQAINEATTLAGKNYDAATEIFIKDPGSTDASIAKANNDIALRTQISRLNQAIEYEKTHNNDPATVAELTKRRDEIQSRKTALDAGAKSGNLEQQNNHNTTDPLWCIGFGNIIGKDSHTGINIVGCAAQIGQLLLKGSAWVLWLAAYMFDYTLDYTLNFKNLVTNIPIVDIGWKILRDVSNIFFIFLLLLAAIGIIVDNKAIGSKSMIPGIIMAAVLINFSLFFTNIVIDASNILTLQFYGQMRGTDPSAAPTNGKVTGVAAAFMQGLNLTSLYNAQGGENDLATKSLGAQAGNAWNIALVGFGGSVLILITAFVFFAATILFLIRAVVFIFLMITSPIFFLAMAVPSAQIKDQAKKWQTTLTNQALFAPTYMLLTFIVVKAVTSKTATGLHGNFSSLFTSSGGAGIETAVSFFVLIMFMIGTLKVSTTFSVAGAKTVDGWGKNTGTWARNTLVRNTAGTVVGGLGSRYANSGIARAWASTPILGTLFGGKAALRGANALTNAKIGGQSYKDRISEKTKADAEMAKQIQDRTVRRGWTESDAAYKDRSKKIKDNDKARAARSLGLNENGETTSWLGLSHASRTARVKAQADFMKGKTKEKDLEEQKEQIKEITIKHLETINANSNITITSGDGGKAITNDNGNLAELKPKDVERAQEEFDKKVMSGNFDSLSTLGKLKFDVDTKRAAMSGTKLRDAGTLEVQKREADDAEKKLQYEIAKTNSSLAKLSQLAIKTAKSDNEDTAKILAALEKEGKK